MPKFAVKINRKPPERKLVAVLGHKGSCLYGYPLYWKNSPIMQKRYFTYFDLLTFLRGPSRYWRKVSYILGRHYRADFPIMLVFIFCIIASIIILHNGRLP